MVIIEDTVIADQTIDQILASVHASGFGAWSPPKGDFGYESYNGMNWKGHNGALHAALYNIVKEPIFPNQSFFRLTTKDECKRLVHSDRNEGEHTAIFYLTEHKEVSGTAFYRHIETGQTYMPTVREMVDTGKKDYWNEAMKDESQWEQIDFVRGIKGRMLIFDAPLFHGRFPLHGVGDDETNGRIVWVCHYFTASDLGAV